MNKTLKTTQVINATYSLQSSTTNFQNIAITRKMKTTRVENLTAMTGEVATDAKNVQNRNYGSPLA